MFTFSNSSSRGIPPIFAMSLKVAFLASVLKIRGLFSFLYFGESFIKYFFSWGYSVTVSLTFEFGVMLFILFFISFYRFSGCGEMPWWYKQCYQVIFIFFEIRIVRLTKKFYALCFHGL